jgi:hypothetical protein
MNGASPLAASALSTRMAQQLLAALPPTAQAVIPHLLARATHVLSPFALC